MFTIRKATVADCELIHKMAKEVFPATYKEILSPEQLDYMMDWMYAPSNVRKQMEEEGHVYSIAYKENEPCGYVSIQQQVKRFSSVFPNFFYKSERTKREILINPQR